MGFFDKAKRLLGLGEDDEPSEPSDGDASSPPSAPPRGDAPRTAAARAAMSRGRGDRRDRPPLPETSGASGPSLDDALTAREAGDEAQARAILRDIDKGGGLRTLLRAAAALEAGDEDELAPLLPVIAAEEPPWRMLLQVACALEGAGASYIERARSANAPGWALGWARALSKDEAERRAGLVELLFEDVALARTVAARDLAITGAVADPEAAQRYASFAHGRDTIRRFGAAQVSRTLDRALVLR
jgi:hypothetical protein